MDLRSTLEALRDFDTALLASTIEYIDKTPPHEYYMGGSIKSITPSLGPTVGIAVTCEIDSSTPESSPDMDGYFRQLDQIHEMKMPVVWVAKAVGSRQDHECVLGDGMGKSLFAAGCLGVVTDGGVRDVSGLLSIPFAAYCRGTTIHHCALRIQKCGNPIAVGGITIRPGDVIHANSEGVIRIPSSCLEDLPSRAIQMRAFENAAHCVFRQTEIKASEKRKRVAELLAEYGFAK